MGKKKKSKRGHSSLCVQFRARDCTPRFRLPLACILMPYLVICVEVALLAINLMLFCFAQMLEGMDLYLNQYLI